MERGKRFVVGRMQQRTKGGRVRAWQSGLGGRKMGRGLGKFVTRGKIRLQEFFWLGTEAAKGMMSYMWGAGGGSHFKGGGGGSSLKCLLMLRKRL